MNIQKGIASQPYTEEQISTLREKGILVLDDFLPEKEIAFTLRHGKPYFNYDLYTLIDMFDPAGFGVVKTEGVAQRGHHVGSFALQYLSFRDSGDSVYIAELGSIVPHELPFTSQAAYFFGQRGFPPEYADPKLFEKLRRHVSEDPNMVVNLVDGSVGDPQYADKFVKSHSRREGEVMVLGSGASHPLWIASAYRKLEPALVSLGLEVVAQDKKVKGFVDMLLEERPASFWMQFGGSVVDEAAVIPFSGSAREVLRMYNRENFE